METKKINTMYEDLLEAQKNIEKVDKDGKNPFFKSEYTTLGASIEACKQALNDNNFIVLQPIESDTEGVYVCTTIIHTSGEKITSRMRITVAKTNDPQAQGSAITYARRYALKALLCMSDFDDDGNEANKEPTQTTQPVQPDHIQQQLQAKGCPKCGGEMVLNPKTGNIFCKAKCWLQNQ